MFTQASGLKNIELEQNAPLSRYTTFQLGGPCRGLFHCSTPQQLETIVKQLAQERAPFILIGGGSNLVVSDQGVPCYVIRYVSDKPIIKRMGNDLIVSGSTSLDALALFSIEQGLRGLEYTSGIPGTVGGAVVGNAGAFGKQVGDVLKSVTLLSKFGRLTQSTAAELGFSYRNSSLKERNDMVVSARFALYPEKRDVLLGEREKILQTRREKHPNLNTHPCAGSFFRNIEPTSKAEKRQAAGWFLEEAGGKNLCIGGALIFEKHANIIVKGPNCKAEDVYALSLKMQQIVKEKFNLDLIREVRFVGKIKNLPQNSFEIFW